MAEPAAGLVPELPLLSWQELAATPPGIDIGAHTATHPRLPALSAEDCDRELSECREEIEQRLARPVRWLAYPYGSCTPGVCSSAARHFELALGTSLRFVSPGASPMNMPRIDMFYLRDGDRSIAFFRHWYAGTSVFEMPRARPGVMSRIAISRIEMFRAGGPVALP